MEQLGLSTADLVRAVQRTMRSRPVRLPASTYPAEQGSQHQTETVAVAKTKSPPLETGSITAGERSVPASSMVPERT